MKLHIGLRQIQLQDILPQPGVEHRLHRLQRRVALNLGETGQPLVRLHLGDSVLTSLVGGLAVDVVRPPPAALGNVDDEQLYAGDFDGSRVRG